MGKFETFSVIMLESLNKTEMFSLYHTVPLKPSYYFICQTFFKSLKKNLTNPKLLNGSDV